MCMVPLLTHRDESSGTTVQIDVPIYVADNKNGRLGLWGYILPVTERAMQTSFLSRTDTSSVTPDRFHQAMFASSDLRHRNLGYVVMLLPCSMDRQPNHCMKPQRRSLAVVAHRPLRSTLLPGILARELHRAIALME